MSNYEKITSMGVEEMAELLATKNAGCFNCKLLPECVSECDKNSDYSFNHCKNKFLKWLESEVEK